MNPSTSAAVIPASSRQALMHSKWSEWVLASGRLPTLVSATPTMAYLPLMFDIKSSVAGLEQLEWWSNGVMHSKPDTPILPILQHSIFIVKSETSLFGTLCSFDHLELFRLSDFELRVFSAFLPINRERRWLPRRINAAETLHSAFEAIEPLLRLPFQFWIDRNSHNS